MMSEDKIARDKAMILFDQGHKRQMNGEFGDAIILYKQSIDTFPTSEAYTFLGWTYNMLDRTDEAIEMCHKAIEIDPDYGNPYNDIGAYLMEMGDFADAVPWFEKAIAAPRYDAPQFPYVNMGRAYEHTGRYRSAILSYEKALVIDPLYFPATWRKMALLGKMN